MARYSFSLFFVFAPYSKGKRRGWRMFNATTLMGINSYTPDEIGTMVKHSQGISLGGSCI